MKIYKKQNVRRETTKIATSRPCDISQTRAKSIRSFARAAFHRVGPHRRLARVAPSPNAPVRDRLSI